MFHSFFNSLARSRYLSFFSHSFSSILWSARTEKSTILQILFFFCYYKVWSSCRDKAIRDYYYYYYYYYYYTLRAFHSYVIEWLSTGRLSDNKSSGLFSLFLPILTVDQSLISNCSSAFTYPLMTAPNNFSLWSVNGKDYIDQKKKWINQLKRYLALPAYKIYQQNAFCKTAQIHQKVLSM